jgi:hypothetical protein
MIANTVAGVYVQSGSDTHIGGVVGPVGSCTGVCNLITGTIGIILESDANYVEGNFIGVNPAGTAPLGSLTTGIRITGKVDQVGGTVSTRNVIAGYSSYGIFISGQTNRVRAGTHADRSGTIDLVSANATGVYLESGTNTIGGTTTAPGKLRWTLQRHGWQHRGRGTARGFQ